MAGNNSVRGDETITFTDNMSFDGTERGGKMTTDGQLWIGSTASRHVRLGQLASADSTVSIGYAAPNILLSVNGSLIPGTITGDTGGAISQSGHNWNIISNVAAINAGATVSFSGSGSTLTLNVSDIPGDNNTFVGKSSGNATMTTNHSTAFGTFTLNKLTSSIFNDAFGYNALFNITSGNGRNAGFGTNTLGSLLTGSYNSALGNAAGISYTTTESSNIIISNSGTAGDNNTIRIGTQGTGNQMQNKCFIAGIVGVTVSNEEFVTINSSTGQLGIRTSGGVGETITGDTGGALSPTAGNWNIISNVASVNCGSTVSFSGSGSTLTLNVSDINGSTLIGQNAGNAALAPNDTACTGIGTNVFRAATSIGNSCAFGVSCLRLTTVSQSNCGYGNSSLGQLLTGSYNSAFGTNSGNSYTGTESSNIVISNTGTIGDNNTIRIGTQGSGNQQQNKCFVAGIVGVTNSNPQIVTVNSSTGQLGVTTSSQLLWNVVSTNQTGATSNGYIFVSPGGALTISLPTTSVVGDTFAVVLDGATSWQITQAAGQQIRLASSTTTLGATGSLTSTAQGNAVTLVCRVANTLWTAISSIGNITVA